jgi:ADP-L-glycero-D-manno-heptose 6-epimerase
VKKVIVTGGAGFIGSVFVSKLNREGIEDILIVDSLGTGEKWKNLTGLRYADYLHKDVFVRKVGDDNLTFSPDALVHLGACTSTKERNVDFLMENNYRYTQILARWAVSRRVRFLYASSAATYGNGDAGFSDETDLSGLRPLNPYGYSKPLFDLYAQRTGLLKHIAGLKFFNVFGPNEYHKGDMASLVFKGYRQIVETGVIRLFRSCRPDFADGGQMRDFVYVKDCVDVMWWLLCGHDAMGIFNLGTGRARSWNDLAQALFAALGQPLCVEYIPMPEDLCGSYQYYTLASTGRLERTGCPLHFRSLEETVRDYVVNHLQASEPHLCWSAVEGDGTAARPSDSLTTVRSGSIIHP